MGAVWMVDVVPGRLVTVKTGFSASCGRRGGDGSAPRPRQPRSRILDLPATSRGGSPLPRGGHTSPGVPPPRRPPRGPRRRAVPPGSWRHAREGLRRPRSQPSRCTVGPALPRAAPCSQLVRLPAARNSQLHEQLKKGRQPILDKGGANPGHSALPQGPGREESKAPPPWHRGPPSPPPRPN